MIYQEEKTAKRVKMFVKELDIKGCSRFRKGQLINLL